MVEKKNFKDDIARSMNLILEDEDYQNVFKAPKKANVKQAFVNDDVIKEAFNKLVSTSNILDEIGLSKSAECVLNVIAQMTEEGVEGLSEDILGQIAEDADIPITGEADILIDEEPSEEPLYDYEQYEEV